MIDQNTIILVLILIVILVAFYSAYLSMDNSRKIKKLQSELKNTLTVLNETLNLKEQLHPNLMEEAVCERPKQKCMPREDLSRYPSLDELGNFEPIDNNTKEAIDNLTSIEQENAESNDNTQEENIEVIETHEKQSGGELEEMSIDELSKNRNLPEDNNIEVSNNQDNNEIENNQNVEELIMEEINEAVANVNEEDINELTEELNELTNEEVIDGENGENGENEDNEENEENEEVVEEVVEENKEESYPDLDNLNKELLSSYSLKNIKSICKREDLRLSGSKNHLIERILKRKEFKVQI